MTKLEPTQLPNKEAWGYRLLLVKKDHKIRIIKDIVPVSEEIGSPISHPTIGSVFKGEATYEHMKLVEDVIYEIIRRKNGGNL